MTTRAAARILTSAAAVAAAMVLAPQPATAACHIADWRSDAVTVDESDGEARLRVYLVGEQPQCSGTVSYETVDDTARAGRDYRARSGELTFEVGDDREETIRIPIIDDDRDESRERFMVRLTGGSGGITPTNNPATVTIRDDDEAASPSPTPSPPSPSPEPTSTALDGAAQAAPTDGGGGNAGAIVGIALALAVLAGAGFWLVRRRATAGGG